mmetsp:Transcript_4889/g.7312  ORF Transcript_4889/g.7312 Transcript_4889/m.7312 type:complete len:257 (-) Transcript_4889:316-1086(-)
MKHSAILLLLISCTPYYLSVVDAFITPSSFSLLITNTRRHHISYLPRDTLLKKPITSWPSSTTNNNAANNLVAMSSTSTAAAAAALPIVTSTFWLGTYGLLQLTLWLKIMTIRSVQPSSTHQLQNLAVTQDIRNLRATRAHGNYIENAPIFSLILLVVDAMNVIPKTLVNGLGALFFFGRIFHMMGMWAYEGSTVGRMVGALATLVSLGIGSGMTIYSAVQVLGGWSGVHVKFGVIALIVLLGNCFAGINVEKKKE